VLVVWREAWRRLWHDEPVAMASPLSMAEVEARLAAAVTHRLRTLRWTADVDQRVLTGRVSDGRVRLHAQRIGDLRTSTRSLLRARLLPAGHGARLCGRFGVPPQLRALAGVMLAVLTIFLGVGIAATVYGVATDTWSPLLLPFVAGPVPAGALLVRVLGRRDSEGRADDEYLMACVEESLGRAQSGVT
jgi:hypothetical protein